MTTKTTKTTTTTSTTTPPSVLFPPKRYFLFDSPKPSPAISTHHIHHHHHSAIKLPKIQIHKVYYTAESAPPMTLVKPERQENFRKEMKKNSGDRKNSDINLVANETQRFTEVDSGERHSSSQSQLHYDPISDHHHHHPHQDGYNPSVLEESEEGEEALLQQSAPPNDDPSVSSLEAGYGMPQIPPPLYDSEHHQGDHGFDHHHDHHHPPQILPPEALKQVLQPTLSSEMLDDELAQINRQIITGYQNNRDSFEQYLKKMNYHAKAMADAEPSFTLNFNPNAATLQAAPAPAPAPRPPQRESVLTRIIDRMYRASPSTYNADPVLEDPVEQVHYIINTPPAARPPAMRLNNIISRHHQLGHLRAAERHAVKAFSHDPAYLPTIVSPAPTKTHLFTFQDAVEANPSSSFPGLTPTSGTSSLVPRKSPSSSLFYRQRVQQQQQQQPLLLNEQPFSQIISFAPSDHKPQHKAPQKQQADLEGKGDLKTEKEDVTTSPLPPLSSVHTLDSDSSTTAVERRPFVQNYQTFEKLPNGGSKVTVVNSTVNQGPADFSSPSPHKLTINMPSLSKMVKVVKTTEILEPHEALKHPMINEINRKLNRPTKKQTKKGLKSAAFRIEKGPLTSTEIDFTTPATVYTPLAEFMQNAPIESLDSITSTTHVASPKQPEHSPPLNFADKVNTTTSNSLNSLLSLYSNSKPFLFLTNFLII
ncbi:hypothetical protein TYRP_012227 [Tyrophagus putrescentiae]|nr:hypothetical protein TYRP_012227 [Tyrophagus putrescentiae]